MEPVVLQDATVPLLVELDAEDGGDEVELGDGAAAGLGVEDDEAAGRARGLVAGPDHRHQRRQVQHLRLPRPAVLCESVCE